MWLLVCKAPDYQQLPARVYWNAEQSTWGRFDQATRFDIGDRWPQPEPHWPGAETSWMPDWPVDLDGFPYSTGELPWRLTHCCGAGTSVNDGPLYCKSCYAAVELAYDTPPRLDANWQPGNGPIRIELGGGEAAAAAPRSPSGYWICQGCGHTVPPGQEDLVIDHVRDCEFVDGAGNPRKGTCRHCGREIEPGFVDYSDTRGWVHTDDDEARCSEAEDSPQAQLLDS